MGSPLKLKLGTLQCYIMLSILKMLHREFSAISNGVHFKFNLNLIQIPQLLLLLNWFKPIL